MKNKFLVVIISIIFILIVVSSEKSCDHDLIKDNIETNVDVNRRYGSTLLSGHAFMCVIMCNDCLNHIEAEHLSQCYEQQFTCCLALGGVPSYCNCYDWSYK